MLLKRLYTHYYIHASGVIRIHGLCVRATKESPRLRGHYYRLILLSLQ
jgi:hypothetical protein